MIQIIVPVENASKTFGVEGESIAQILPFLSATHPLSNTVDIEKTLLELIMHEPIRVIFKAL